MKKSLKNNKLNLKDICFSAIINDYCRYCTFKNGIHTTKCIHNDLNLYQQLCIADITQKNKKKIKKIHEN